MVEKGRFVLKTAVLSMDVSWTIARVIRIFRTLSTSQIRNVYWSLFCTIQYTLPCTSLMLQRVHIHDTSLIHTLRTLSPERHPLYTPVRHPPSRE